MMKIINRFIIVVVLFAGIAFSVPKQLTITGVIKDKQSGTCLENVNISLVKQNGGTVTNRRGEFHLMCRICGDDTLMITHVGYKKVVVALSELVSISQPITLFLEPAVIEMPAVSIAVNRYEQEQQIFMAEPTPRFFSAKDIMAVPTVAVPDLHRALQSVPGIVSNNELAPQLNVRGGNIDQNLILLDGAPVYYPYHLGLMSSFNVDMIDAVNLSGGGFSARFGNRLSSIISIHTKQPAKNFKNCLNISLLNADVTIGGTLGNKLGWLVSGRRSYYDLLAKLAKENIPLVFQDYYGKIIFQPNTHHYCSLSAYQNMDSNNISDKTKTTLYSTIDEEQEVCEQVSQDQFNIQNQILSFIWEYHYSTKLQTRLQITSSAYSNRFHNKYYVEYPDKLQPKFWEAKKKIDLRIAEQNKEFNADIHNRFRNSNLEFSAHWSAFPDLQIDSGFLFSRFSFRYGWHGKYDFAQPYVNYFFDYSPDDTYFYHNSLNTQSGYVEYLWNVNQRLTLRNGLRFTQWDGVNRLFVEPRLNALYHINKKTSIKLAYGTYTQGIATCLENGLVQVLELYFPATKNDQVEQAHHFIVNFEYKIQQHQGINITAYYKPFSHLLKSVLVDGGQQFDHVSGLAYGLEIEAKFDFLGIRNSVSYVLSRSQRTYDTVRYDTNFDRRHRLYWMMQKNIRNWTLSATWELYSGQPYNPGRYLALYRDLDYIPYTPHATRDVRSYYWRSYEVDVPPGRIRYPYYHRMDVSISRTFFMKQRYTITPYVSIRNIYNRKNVLYYRTLRYGWYFEDENYDKGKFVLERDPFSLPIIPTFGVRFAF